MGERGRAKDVPGAAGGSDPGQVPEQERYGEPPVGETPKLEPDPTSQPQPSDDEEGVGGTQVDDQPTKKPRGPGWQARAVDRPGTRRVIGRGVMVGERWRHREYFWPVVAPVIRLAVCVLLDLRVVGGERIPARGPVLLAANHVSFLDPVVVAVALDRCGRRSRFVALAELFQRPLLGWVLRHGRMIPAVRGEPPERMAEHAGAALAAGEAVLVYPKGTIVPPGQIRPARPGAGLLALRTGVAVLPVASSGAERRPGRRLLWCRRRVSVVIGPPVDLRPWRGRLDRQAQLEASATLLAAIRSLRPESG
jgi:1-acyl-sn-glycerol-3-phosphate acyltransferase